MKTTTNQVKKAERKSPDLFHFDKVERNLEGITRQYQKRKKEE